MHTSTAWFRDNGYLFLKTDPATGPLPVIPEGVRFEVADIDWPRTRAYTNGLAGYYLNIAGREHDGCVPPDEAPIITVPRPTAAMTRPRISRGVMSASSAEQAGIKKAIESATTQRSASTWPSRSAGNSPPHRGQSFQGRRQSSWQRGFCSSC